MIERYGDSISGNCYKLQLACAQLDIDYTWHEIDIMADGSDLAGVSRFEKANVMRWMFFEQYSHEPYIATSRFIIRYLGRPEDREGDLESRKGGGYMALDLLEQELSDNDFIAMRKKP